MLTKRICYSQKCMGSSWSGVVKEVDTETCPDCGSILVPRKGRIQKNGKFRPIQRYLSERKHKE